MSIKFSVVSATVGIILAIHSANAASPQQELFNLQAQLNQLNRQVQQIQSVPATSSLSTDSKLPLGTLSKTHFPYAIVSVKNTLDAPLVVGGQVEADAQAWNGSYTYSSGGQQGESVAFTKLYLFSMANINNWTTAVVSLKNSLPNYGAQVDRAFLTFGDFHQSPWYFTAGNTYLPFGNFSGNGPLDNSLSTNSFRVSPTTQAILGLKSDGFDTDFGMYSNSNFDNGLHDFLINTEWTGTLDSTSNIILGAGYINDIRGTSSGVGQAYASGTPSASSPLTGPATGAYDANISLNLANFSLLWEYNKTSTSANVNNQAIGKPSVWMLGTVYKHVLLNRPAQYQLSFSQSKNMQNIPLALAANYAQNLNATGIKTEWLASVVSEVWKNTYLGPELDYDHMYAGNNTWTLTMDATAYF